MNTYSTLFEDNAETLYLVTEPAQLHRTKHKCVKHHHFKQCVNLFQSYRHR